LGSGSDSEILDAASEASSAQVRLYIQRSSNYVLTVVLYAIVLFFAGMSTKLKNQRLRWAMTGAGCAVLFGVLIWIATFPVSLQVGAPGPTESASGQGIVRPSGGGSRRS